jgi:flagellar basal-body rod protein FlgF
MATILETTGVSVNSLMQEHNTITHNLANASTSGYKRRVNAFSQILDSMTNVNQPATGTTAVRLGVDFSQGHMVQTGRSLDLALQGDGLFVVETPEGPLYTRSGSFQTNGQGQVVDPQGRIIAGDGGAIVVPKEVSLSELNVSQDGKVSSGSLIIGRFKIVEFDNRSQDLTPAGANCFAANGTGEPKVAKNTTVQQGYQESSNVNTMEELVGLITVTRVYESSMKILTSKGDAERTLLTAAMG